MRVVSRSEFFDSGAKLFDDTDIIVIKSCFEPNSLQTALTQFQQTYKISEEIKISGPNSYNRSNYNRLDIGDFSQSNARFVRTCVDFDWNRSTQFAEVFIELQEIRDWFLDIKPSADHTYSLDGKTLANLPKILHYPQGGGFMCRHYDGYNNDCIPNILISLTKRGVDFSEGGVYYEEDGCHIDAEELLEVGDVYFHTSSTIHGVNAVDASQELDLSLNQGRWALLLSLEAIPAS